MGSDQTIVRLGILRDDSEGVVLTQNNAADLEETEDVVDIARDRSLEQRVGVTMCMMTSAAGVIAT